MKECDILLVVYRWLLGRAGDSVFKFYSLRKESWTTKPILKILVFELKHPPHSSGDSHTHPENVLSAACAQEACLHSPRLALRTSVRACGFPRQVPMMSLGQHALLRPVVALLW